MNRLEQSDEQEEHKKKATKPSTTRPPTDEQLQCLAEQTLGPGGCLVHCGEIQDGWWIARCESDRQKSAIIVMGCSRAAAAWAMADVLNGIKVRTRKAKK